MEIAHIVIGRAVVAAQMLETALVPIFELHRIHTEPGRYEATRGMLPNGSFKQPTSSMLNMLVDRGNISTELEARIRTYIENRHLLIHRWIQERGIPEAVEDWKAIALLAITVEKEANSLAQRFVAYVLKYGNPEDSEVTPEEFKSRMAEIFLATDPAPDGTIVA